MSTEFRAEVEAALEAADPEELLGVIIDLALAAEEAGWAEDRLLDLARHPDADVRGHALVGFAHLAARFGAIGRKRVQPILEAALADEKAYVREQAEATLDELGWPIPETRS